MTMEDLTVSGATRADDLFCPKITQYKRKRVVTKRNKEL